MSTPTGAAATITAQHGETGRMWEGPRHLLPTGYVEVRSSNQQLLADLRTALSSVRGPFSLMDKAADEIERLTAQVAELDHDLIDRTAERDSLWKQRDALALIEAAALRVASSRRDGIVADQGALDRLDAVLEGRPMPPVQLDALPPVVTLDAKRLKDYFDHANCITHPSLYYSSAEPFTAWCREIDEYMRDRADATKIGAGMPPDGAPSVPATPASTKEVFETEMLPKLRQLVRADETPAPLPDHRACTRGECDGFSAAVARIAELEAMINTPHTKDFLQAVNLEAVHQRERGVADHDAGKTDADWFWLLGYLSQKAMHAGNAVKWARESDAVAEPEEAAALHEAKRLHHIVTTAAACLNWHAARSGVDTRMRPGIDPPAGAAVSEKPAETGGSR